MTKKSRSENKWNANQWKNEHDIQKGDKNVQKYTWYSNNLTYMIHHIYFPLQLKVENNGVKNLYRKLLNDLDLNRYLKIWFLIKSNASIEIHVKQAVASFTRLAKHVIQNGWQQTVYIFPTNQETK